MTGSYTWIRSIVDSNVASLNTSMAWQVGLLSVNAGSQLYRTETFLSTGKTDLLTEYYYITLSRKLF